MRTRSEMAGRRSLAVVLGMLALLGASTAARAGNVLISEPGGGSDAPNAGPWTLTFQDFNPSFNPHVHVISVDPENIHFTYMSDSGASQTQLTIAQLIETEPRGGSVVSDTMFVLQHRGNKLLDITILEGAGGIPPGLVPQVLETSGYQAMITVPKKVGGSGSVSGPRTDTLFLQSSSVPEPASLALLGIGMTGFLAFRRFFKKTSVA